MLRRQSSITMLKTPNRNICLAQEMTREAPGRAFLPQHIRFPHHQQSSHWWEALWTHWLKSSTIKETTAVPNFRKSEYETELEHGKKDSLFQTFLAFLWPSKENVAVMPPCELDSHFLNFSSCLCTHKPDASGTCEVALATSYFSPPSPGFAISSIRAVTADLKAPSTRQTTHNLFLSDQRLIHSTSVFLLRFQTPLQRT